MGDGLHAVADSIGVGCIRLDSVEGLEHRRGLSEGEAAVHTFGGTSENKKKKVRYRQMKD